jgi:hypothetical protein
MPSAFRDPKTLPNWIELDYYRRPRPLRRWRWWLTLGTLVVVAVAVGAHYLTPRARRDYEAGPVSAAHALFANDCGRCHTEAFQTPKRFWPGNASLATVPNEACVRCHAGPPHNAAQSAETAGKDCAGCHREHRGREVLARLPDGTCLACHADLKAHSLRRGECPFANVSEGFPDGHPPFRQLTDPGQLSFNHKKHLQGEKVVTKDGRRLQCDDCHKPDTAGHYMQPIAYQTHCQACHPLSVQLAGRPADAEAQKVAAAFAREPAPHREPEVVRGVLRDRLIGLARHFQLKPGGDDRGLPRPRDADDFTAAEWAQAQKMLSEVEIIPFLSLQEKQGRGLLFDRSGGCAFCHVEKDPDKRKPGELPQYRETDVPKRWYTHSRFSHERHRMVDCGVCHDRVLEKSQTADVMLPAREVCANCHSPKANGGLGARHDCVECHTYHPRDVPDPHARRPLGDLLRR